MLEGCVWMDATCAKDPDLESVCWVSYRLFLVGFFGIQVCVWAGPMSNRRKEKMKQGGREQK